MAAYIVAQLDVKNTNWQKEYGPKAGALVQKHGGKVLAGAGAAMEKLEGDEKLPNVLFILEFPSLEQAKAWYNDHSRLKAAARRPPDNGTGVV